MSTWTLRVNKILDELVEENVQLLGYTSKAELIREAVREFLLKQNMGRLGLLTLERKKNEGKLIDPKEALRHFRSYPSDISKVNAVIAEERATIDKILLHLAVDSENGFSDP